MIVRHLFVFLVAAFTACSINAQHEESIHSFVTAAHKRMFDQTNLMVFGNLRLAKSAVKGTVAVTGSASLEDFEFAGDKNCDVKTRALTVVGGLNARMGSINNGYTVAGRRSDISRTVRMPCSQKVVPYNPQKLSIIPYEDLQFSLIKESGDMCVSATSGEVQMENETMKFVPANNSYSCYTVFEVNPDDLRLIKRWEYTGEDPERNVIISVKGKRASMRDFAMIGFNAKRTLLLFCSSYGIFEFFNSRIHASVFAPLTTFTVMDTIVNGSMITGPLRGTLAVLKTPYLTC